MEEASKPDGCTREVVCWKDEAGRIGVKFRRVQSEIYVSAVVEDSSADRAGLVAGDQIVQINGTAVNGWEANRCMNLLQRTDPVTILFTAIRAIPKPPPYHMIADSCEQSMMMSPPTPDVHHYGAARARETPANHNIREVKLCRDRKGKIGLRVQRVGTQVLIASVQANSPAALADLEAGLVVLKINGVGLAEWSTDQCMKLLRITNPTILEVASAFRYCRVLEIQHPCDKSKSRQVVCSKDVKGRIGLKVKCFSTGLFVSRTQSPDAAAARAGLRFGDQILEIDGTAVAGWDTDMCMMYLKKATRKTVVITIRDRPFQKVVTIQKDGTGFVGFCYLHGKITQVPVETPASRGGLLPNHQLLEVNGQNVMGLKDIEISNIIAEAPNVFTMAIVSSRFYNCVADM